mmetsp:Transcript_77102/g.160493  ORF Transcript_77102/g.160493 Transcript_77102/m.160493 type:complete len:322 (-) Transcript_77102:473-1438(-)
MLFPLSRDFSATKLFQSGRNEVPLRHRTWQASVPGAEERALEVHKLLSEKRSYSEHLKRIDQRAEELRSMDQQFAREHRAGLQEMKQRFDEQSQENRRALQQSIREFNHQQNEAKVARAAKFQQERGDYKERRMEMENRVRSMPMINGEGGPRESQERTRARENLGQDFSNVHAQYYQDLHEVKDKLNSRPNLTIGSKRRSQDDILAERRAQGLAHLGKTTREYCQELEGHYDKHHQRIQNIRQSHQEHFQAHLDHRMAAMDAFNAKLSSQKQLIRDELQAREERVNARGKSYGGYVPKAKSDRRLQLEAAEAELNVTMAR